MPAEDNLALHWPDHHGVRRHQRSCHGEAQKAKVKSLTPTYIAHTLVKGTLRGFLPFVG